ncbi:MAG: hypothetical protein KAU90_01630, partial [Sulfurovaceae bacterium]|nr:hypothetical protein [Sulfurovaceae bacterium]
NAGFEEPKVGANYAIVNEDEVPYWDTTASDNKIELWQTNYMDVPSDTGEQFAELNAYEMASMYQDVKVIPGTKIKWSIAHRGRDGVDVATVSIGSPNNLKVVETMSDDKDKWGHYSGTYIVPEGQTVVRFSFDAVSSSTGDTTRGNFIDSFTLSIENVDSDNDGIPNYLDLDSDNDGIPDNVEAQITKGYKAPSGSVDKNGTYSAIYGKDGIKPIDTDEDNVTDMLDTDSDNDITLDKIESGLVLSNSDANNDGIDDAIHASYKKVNGDINNPSTDLKENDGATSDVDYRSLQDTDSDGIPNIVDLDDDNDGVLDVNEMKACLINSQNIAGTIGVSGSSYPVIDGSKFSLESTDITYGKTITSGSSAYVYGYTAGLQGDALRFHSSSSDEKAYDEFSLTFSSPIKDAQWKITDFDEDEIVTIKIFDEKGNIYDLSKVGITSIGTRIKQSGNTFIE